VEGWPRATREELANAFSPGDNVGIRIEPPIFVVDVDDARLARLIEDETPPTWTVKTRRGIHYYFMASSYYPKTNKRSRLIQLLAEGCQVVAPPSVVEGHEYRFLVDPRETPIVELEENKIKLIEMIIDAIAKHEKLIIEFARFWTEGHRHNLSLWLNGALRKSGIPRFEAAAIVKSICLLAEDPELKDRLRALDDSYKKPLNEIAAWSKLREELQLIVGREMAEKLLSLLPSPPEHEDEKRRDERRIKILSLALPSGLVLEAIGAPNSLNDYDARLLIYRDGRFEIADEYALDGAVIEPRHPRSYPYRPYVISDFSFKTRLELIDLIHREIERFVDAEPEEKATFTAFILLSYVQEFFDAVPYLYLVGDCESGKSHLLNLMAELCYRPLAGVSHTAADLYSYLDDGVPLTILEDEFQGSEKDNEKMKIYKAGYKRGAKVARVTTFEGGRRVDYFNCYGIKIMAAEKLIENRGLMQRCIVIEMVEGFPQKDHYDPEDYARFAWLRSELLKWRMRVLAGHEQLPSISVDWLRGRDRELYLPLLTVLHGSRLYDVLEGFLRRKVEEKIMERAYSLEAMITRCVIELLNNGPEVYFGELWDKLLNELGGEEIKPLHAVTARAMETELFGTVSKKDVAKILSERLGMTKVKTRREGRNVILYKPNWPKLERARKKYLGNMLSSLAPYAPNHLGTPALENRPEKPLEADFPGVS
jgi:hypothetical protein